MRENGEQARKMSKKLEYSDNEVLLIKPASTL